MNNGTSDNLDNNKLFTYLSDIGCCNTCCLRFFKARGDEYKDVFESLSKLGIQQEVIDHNVEKKRRLNTCIACLDLFADSFLEELIKKITENTIIKEYDCKEFVLALSCPILLNIRQLSLWISLIRKFTKIKFDKDKSPDVPLKEAIKLILGPKLAKELNKEYNPNGIMINVTLNHVDEKSEIQKLLDVGMKIFNGKISRNKHQKPNEITRGFFEKHYVPSKINLEVYEELLRVPPDVPSSGLYVESISITGPTVFVAGRYRKLSRGLPHTPWILQGKRVMDNSIQEIIVEKVSKHFKALDANIIFSSSGREDVDVRCLGDGRPFVLEISDSKLTYLPMELARQIELDIDTSKLISIKNLQIVKREELVHIKSGEENKRKMYRALCILDKPITIEMLKKLNMPDGFQINQLTPIRVLHRRPLHNRPRTIHSVKGFVQKNNPKVIVLDITTQAGTYVKELIHGEFGRTHPSISSILGVWIDIIALDVNAIELDWPKNIDNRNINCVES